MDLPVVYRHFKVNLDSVGRGLAVVTAGTLFAEMGFSWTFVGKQNITSNVRFAVFYIVLKVR